MSIKYVVCFSGGHSSALCAVECVRKYGKENVILLNHDISSEVEDSDIKRFKQEVADYLGLEITYSNTKNFEEKTPLRLCKKRNGFKLGNGVAMCTYHLKTKPFLRWLRQNYPVEEGQIRQDIRLVYGFDKKETSRIQRRIGVMGDKGYLCEFPLAFWERTIENIEEVGIKRPSTYEFFRHANCKGCLNSGKQQWYVVYCLYPELWNEAKETENEVGYSILKDTFLEDLEHKFALMKCKGIVPTEKTSAQRFWADVRKHIPNDTQALPCECAI